MKKLKILVTGGAGFIGSHVVDAYISAGHSVSVIDNLSTGNPANVHPKARFYKVDIRDSAGVAAVFSREKPEIVNHQAALASVTLSLKRPLETYEVNTLGTINLLLASAPYIKKFIFASSGGAIYGQPKKIPTTEQELPSPISAYGFSKQLAEDAVRFYAGQLGFEYIILRPSNVFGPRQNNGGEGGIFAIFTALAATGSQPTIYRKESTRDYVYVTDIAKANLLATTKAKNETLHISSARQTSNQQVYEIIAKEFDWQKKPIYQAARPGEIARSALSAVKAEKMLGWQPTVSIPQGVKNMKLY